MWNGSATSGISCPMLNLLTRMISAWRERSTPLRQTWKTSWKPMRTVGYNANRLSVKLLRRTQTAFKAFTLCGFQEGGHGLLDHAGRTSDEGRSSRRRVGIQKIWLGESDQPTSTSPSACCSGTATDFSTWPCRNDWIHCARHHMPGTRCWWDLTRLNEMVLAP